MQSFRQLQVKVRQSTLSFSLSCLNMLLLKQNKSSSLVNQINTGHYRFCNTTTHLQTVVDTYVTAITSNSINQRIFNRRDDRLTSYNTYNKSDGSKRSFLKTEYSKAQQHGYKYEHGCQDTKDGYCKQSTGGIN